MKFIPCFALALLLIVCGCEDQEDTRNAATTLYPNGSSAGAGGGVDGGGAGAGDALPGGGGGAGDAAAGAGETPPTLTINHPSVTEGNAGNKNLVFTLSLSRASTEVVSVSFQPSGKGTTASLPQDATAPGAAAIVFNPGQTSHTITYVVHGDTDIEPDETVGVTLLQQQNCVLGNAQGIGTILNDD